MTSIFSYLLMNEFRYQFPSWKFAWAQIVAMILGIFTYAMTSEAIGPALSGVSGWEGHTYFQYVLIGELFIALPAACLQVFVRTLSYLHNTNNLEEILLNHKYPIWTLYQIAGSLLVRELIQIAMWVVAGIIVFAGHSMSLGQLASLIMLMICGSLIFLQIGFLVGLLYLHTGRGQGILTQLSYFFSILSGVFFPMQAVTGQLGNFAVYISPYTIYMENVRRLWAGQEFQYWGAAFLIIGLVIFFTFGFTRWLASGAQYYLRQTRFFMSHS